MAFDLKQDTKAVQSLSRRPSKVRSSLSKRVLKAYSGSGGPAGVFYGFLIVWLGTASIFAVLSELVSM